MRRGEPYSVVVFGLLQRGRELETATGHSGGLGHVHIAGNYTQNIGYSNRES